MAARGKLQSSEIKVEGGRGDRAEEVKRSGVVCVDTRKEHDSIIRGLEEERTDKSSRH